MSLPRRLRNDEIARILDRLPQPKSFDDEASALATTNLRLILQNKYLPYVQICEEDVDNYATEMVKMITSAFVEEGSPVGANGAMSLSSAITQSTMKTHSAISGESGKLQSGIRQLDNLLKIQKEVSEPRMTIHFNTMVTTEDVMDIRRSIEQVTIADLISKVVIGKGIEVNKKYWWHSLNRTVDTYMETRKVLVRFYLNYDKMYEHRLLPTKVKEAMEISLGKEDRSSDYLFVASPLVASTNEEDIEYCIIDAFYVKQLESQDKIEFMYQHNLTAGFGITCVKGMLGVTTVVPKSIKMYSLFKEERELREYERRDGDRGDLKAVDIDYETVSNIFSISLNYLREELAEADIEIVREVECPTLGSVTAFKRDPRLRIETFIVRKTEESVLKTLIERKTLYVYAVTYGANIRELSRLPIVDSTRISSNDARQMQLFYGVEVAYANHLMLLYNALGDVSSRDVDSRHIMLLMDLMFASEQASGIGYHGSKGRGADFVDIASMSSASAVFTTAAMNKLTSKKGSVNTAILQGSMMSLGTKAKRREILQSKVDASKKKMSTLDLVLSETGNWEGTSSATMTNIVNAPPLEPPLELPLESPLPPLADPYNIDIEKYINVRFRCSLADRSEAIKLFLSGGTKRKEALTYSSVVRTVNTALASTRPPEPRYIISIKMADSLLAPFAIGPRDYSKATSRERADLNLRERYGGSSTVEQSLRQLYAEHAYFLRK